MANSLALTELRNEGFVPWVVELHNIGQHARDLWSFADVAAYDPTYIRRPRLVNACGEDLQVHIKKYLEGGIDKKTGVPFPPNKHLPNLIHWFDCYLYSFVKRTMRNADNKLLDRKVYVCRKWRYILSPEGKGSFEKEEAPND
jgi:hypothetical protein